MSRPVLEFWHEFASTYSYPAAAFETARSEPIQAALKANVIEAELHGVFGASSFVTSDGEFFWGNDRLEPAVDWAANRALETA